MNLTARRDFTTAKLGELDSNLKVAEKKFGVKASVYATGSYGRHEASEDSEDSDLDLFIVTKAIYGHDEQTTSRSLSRLSEIVLKANLILGN